MDVDVVIIGGGPGGVTAGIYAVRAGLNAVLLEKMYIGGQAVNSHLIENYPGFIGGIAGADLGQLMEKQAKELGLNIVKSEVKSVDLKEKIKIVTTAKIQYNAKAVIIATGSEPRKMGLAREEEFAGKGVSYCATCDGGFYKNKEVAIIGGGDTALNDAAYMARIASKVYLVHRRDAFRGAKVSVDAALKFDNVEVIYDSVAEEIIADKEFKGLKVKNLKTGESTTLNIQATFVAIGSDPRSELFKDQIELKEAGVLTDARCKTSQEGVYAAGDVRFGSPKQVVTAAGDGAIAAMDLAEYISRI